MENKLKTMVEKINDLKQKAETELSILAPSVRPAWKLTVAKAKDQLASLRPQYEQELSKLVFGIFLTGDSSAVERFVNLVKTENAVGAVVDLDACYKDLSVQLEKSMGSTRQVKINQTTYMVRRIKDMAREIEVELNLRQLEIPVSAILKDSQEVVDWCKSQVQRFLGHKFMKKTSWNTVVDSALAEGFADTAMPVIFHGGTDAEIREMGAICTKGTYVVELNKDQEITNDFMIKTFKEAQKTLKKNKTEK